MRILKGAPSWISNKQFQNHPRDVQGYIQPWTLSLQMLSKVWARHDNGGSFGKAERRNILFQSVWHLERVLISRFRTKPWDNVLRPSTISGSRNVLRRSFNTRGGHVAERAMIGTDGNSVRNL